MSITSVYCGRQCIMGGELVLWPKGHGFNSRVDSWDSVGIPAVQMDAM
uniref:Uncharacterized protein n=1 Tax=Anguilla anguilla TaxID=7936 RepID=A0A0E9Q5H0_ANGAN